jgi:hypothetical protein
MEERVKTEAAKLVSGSRDAIVCSVDENGFPNAKKIQRAKGAAFRALLYCFVALRASLQGELV